MVGARRATSQKAKGDRERLKESDLLSRGKGRKLCCNRVSVVGHVPAGVVFNPAVSVSVGQSGGRAWPADSQSQYFSWKLNKYTTTWTVSGSERTKARNVNQIKVK